MLDFHGKWKYKMTCNVSASTEYIVWCTFIQLFTCLLFNLMHRPTKDRCLEIGMTRIDAESFRIKGEFNFFLKPKLDGKIHAKFC